MKPLEVPGVLLPCHGPFAWGANPHKAVQNALALEEIARMGFYTRLLSPQIEPVPAALSEKHHQRKHGAAAYYGQPK